MFSDICLKMKVCKDKTHPAIYPNGCIYIASFSRVKNNDKKLKKEAIKKYSNIPIRGHRIITTPELFIDIKAWHFEPNMVLDEDKNICFIRMNKIGSLKDDYLVVDVWLESVKENKKGTIVSALVPGEGLEPLSHISGGKF